MEINDETVAAVVPIENSIEGVVRETQDKLIATAKNGYGIFAETRLEIEHALIGYGSINDVKIILSHPQALAQCREYIYKNWGNNVKLHPTFSTSEAISLLNEEDKETAAIGNKYCANLYKVPVIDSEINDEDNNTTRFILLSKFTPPPETQNKVSIVFATENKSGALNKVLGILDEFDINLSYIDSRPSGRRMGEYIFYADFEGHTTNAKVTNALNKLLPFVTMLEILSKGAVYV